MAALGAALCVAAAGGALAAGPGDGVRVTVTQGPGPGEITLTWTGGQPTFEVFRSNSPVDVANPANKLGETSDRTWIDAPPPGAIFYYQVTRGRLLGLLRVRRH
jgi:protein involved in polysaccharide export with SLBB domain